MPRNLSQLLGNGDTIKPEIRRGQGYQLSTQQPEIENAQEQKIESSQVSNEVAEGIIRNSRGLRLRDDLFFDCKRIAVEQRRKLYEVVEQALQEYIEKYDSSK